MNPTRTIEQIKEALALPDTSALSFSAEEVRAALAQQFYFGMDIALAAPIRGAGEVPAGFKLVPIDPTRAMLDAAHAVHQNGGYVGESYIEMLAVAPAAPLLAQPEQRTERALRKLCDDLDGMKRRLRHTPGTGQSDSYLLHEDVAAYVEDARKALTMDCGEPAGQYEAHRAAWEYSFIHSSATGRGDSEIGPCLTYDRSIAFGVGCMNQCAVFVSSEQTSSAACGGCSQESPVNAIRFARRVDADMFAAEDPEDVRIAQHVWVGESVETAAPGASTEDKQ